ncbi:hypothetical protein GCM10022281_09320 [Sphingomonas rosea]|uniref:Pentapeptide MXKDX repeat protein n=1 Tax=Sphingomonas rosea TaxID=335605 RepID=A0ABP7TVC9_9SPHN
MRALILVAGAALSLAACGSNKDAVDNADANLMTIDNTGMDANMATPMDANMMDANMMGGADGNAMTNGSTEANMMANDMNTNDRDTNLANGM